MQILQPTAMATDGRAVARDADGKVVFVEGALPGETVSAEATAWHSSWSAAATVEVLKPSPDRVEAPCPDRARGCGGCPWQHVSIGGQRRMKEELVVDSLRRFGGVGSPPLEPTVELPPWRYRTTFRAGVAGGRPALRATGSEELVNIGSCMIAHPLLADLVGAEVGSASSVLLRAGARTGDRSVVTEPPAGGTAGVPSGSIEEEAAGRRWRISPGSFFQARPDGADALARLVLEAAGSPGRAVDLYSGVGLFAGALASAGWRVTAVESSASAVADAAANGVETLRSEVGRWRPLPAEFVVADPSRTGLGRPGVAAVVGTGASRLALVSCDAAALGRDARLLGEAGYQPVSVTLVDMLAHSFRVEVVTVFDLATPRRGPRRGRRPPARPR